MTGEILIVLFMNNKVSNKEFVFKPLPIIRVINPRVTNMHIYEGIGRVLIVIFMINKVSDLTTNFKLRPCVQVLT